MRSPRYRKWRRKRILQIVSLQEGRTSRRLTRMILEYRDLLAPNAVMNEGLISHFLNQAYLNSQETIP